MSENADPYAGDPYADMTPAYGSPDGAVGAGFVDFSVEAAMPLGPPPEPDPSVADPAADPAAAVPAPTEPVVDAVPAPVADSGPAQSEPAPAAVPAVTGANDSSVADALAVLRAQATESAGAAQRQAEALTALNAQVGELLRLRARDVDLADRLYAENTRLRTGEFAAAVAPLLTGLLRLHDQMASLANGDAASVAGMLRIQLLQILDTAAGLTPFDPQPGERFDSSRHAGVGRAVTIDPTAEGTVAKSLKPGFERADGSVVRVAQVEVHRFESRQ